MWDDFYFTDEQVDHLQMILTKGEYKIRHDGKVVPSLPSGAPQVPWVFIKFAPNHHCDFWADVCFPHFRLVPAFCRTRCHKVVVKPRTVAELFRLYDIMTALNLPSKCGIDIRDYTFGPYAAFFYCNSMEEGLARYATVREVVSNELSPDIPVILKKGCTEMEAMLPTDQWGDPSPEDIELEERLSDIFAFEGEPHFHQPDWLKCLIRRRWIRHAIKIGDPTYREVTTYDPAVKAVTYHDRVEKNDQAPNVSVDNNPTPIDKEDNPNGSEQNHVHQARSKVPRTERSVT